MGILNIFLELCFLAFPNIEILYFGFSKHWNSIFWLFQTLAFWILAFPNIGILDFVISKHGDSKYFFRALFFGFSKYWNSVFWFFQTLEFYILAFSNIGILDFGFSKHWSFGFWLFQTLKFWIFSFPKTGILDFSISKHCEFLIFLFSSIIWTFPNAAGLEIKKMFRSPFGDQPEKYSRQMQIFSRQFVKCKWRVQLIGTGLLIFRAGAEPRNSQKHAKYREIQWKSYQIHVCITYLKRISAIGAIYLP